MRDAVLQYMALAEKKSRILEHLGLGSPEGMPWRPSTGPKTPIIPSACGPFLPGWRRLPVKASLWPSLFTPLPASRWIPWAFGPTASAAEPVSHLGYGP